MNKSYVICYGWLAGSAAGELTKFARWIADAEPPLLIAHLNTDPFTHVNLSPQVLESMRAAGTEVFAYVSTKYGEVSLGSALKNAEEALNAGVDGIFFDETPVRLYGGDLAYYRTLWQRVHADGKRVIVNPGRADIDESIMPYTDIVHVEHAWRALDTSRPWIRDHPERFMAVSSNEPKAMPGWFDRDSGIAETREAWNHGLGWHFSTNRYIELSDWFPEYMDVVNPDDD